MTCRGSPSYTPPPRERRSPTLSPIESESDHSPEPEPRRPAMRPRSPPPVQRKGMSVTLKQYRAVHVSSHI